MRPEPGPTDALSIEQYFPFCIIDPESMRFVQVSSALAALLGHSQAVLLTKNLSHLVEPGDVAALRESTGALDQSAGRAVSLRLRRASGELWPVEIGWRRIRHLGVFAALGLIQDLSDREALPNDRKELERNLREQEANLRLAQELLGIGIWEMEVATGRLIWSEHVHHIYGVSPDSFDPNFEAYVSLVHPDERADLVARFEEFKNSEAALFQFTNRIQRPDGSTAYVRAIAERHGKDGADWLTGVIQDVTAEVQAREKLAEASRMQRIAEHAARLGGWRVDLNPSRITWSPETCAIHGVPEGTAPSFEAAIDYYAPEYRDRIRTVFAACVETGQPYDEVAQLNLPDDRHVWVRTIGEAVHDEQGIVIAVQGAFQDISEMVAARDRSEDLARRLRQTLESISDAFFVLDHDWRFSFLNGQAEALLRRSRADLVGKVIWDEFPATVGSPFQNNYEAAVNTGRAVRFQEYFPPLEGWFEVNAYPTPEGLAVYFRDITERKRVEATMQQSEERFHLVAKATNDVVWDWDMTAGTVWWNENLKLLFGHDPARVEPGPASWMNRVHPDDKEWVLESLDTAVAGSASTWAEEYRFMHADGRARIVVDRAFLLRNAEGKAVRMLGSMVDVTGERETESRLRQAQKLEAVGQLTGGVAHDFNNLLTVILGNAEMLGDDLGDPQQHLLAEMIATAAERGAELTHRLLAFSRKQPLKPQVVDVGALISGTGGLLRRTLPENIDIKIVRTGGLWNAEIDASQLDSAILNLALNARDAMPEGGCLTIETANVTLDDDDAAREQDVVPGQYVMITVTDTGEGIPASVMEHIFEPFFTTKEIGKGSGLGLSMVYGFVKQSRGHIRIYSEPSEGTSIKLYFPRASEADAHVTLLKSASPIVGGHETILVVEDDALVREHLNTQLKGLGYQVLGAASGPDALEILHQMPQIDLLLTDVVMPGGMNGRALADAARKLRPDMKVLYTSGYTEDAIVHQGRLDPGVDLLSKPYRREQLAAKVRMVLDERK